MEKIYYIGFYDTYEYQNEKRTGAPSGRNKMEYIFQSIEKNGYHIEILSPAWTAHQSGRFARRIVKISDRVTLVLCSTFGASNIFMKFFRKYIPICWLFLMLLLNVSKSDTVISYHSMDLMWPVYLAKKIKKFKLLLEVEEIYQDVKQYNRVARKMEYKIFEIADKYLFSNDLLNKKINKNNKPYEVIYGTYQLEYDRKCKFEDKKIHVVYAGTFNPRKGGAV